MSLDAQTILEPILHNDVSGVRMFGATPRGWAEFAGHAEVAALFDAVASV